MSKNYYIVQFNDLTFDKQQEMIQEISAHIYGELEEETKNGKYGVNFGRKEYKGMTWQEACCREYSIDFGLWETEEEAKKFDWDFAVKQYAEERAEEKLRATYVNWEVEI